MSAPNSTSSCVWSESIIVDTKSSVFDMECDFQNNVPPNFEPDGVLFLHSDRTSPDAVLYLTDDREFVSTDYPPTPDSSDSFDVSELYSSKDATLFDVNELYSVQNCLNTSFVHTASKDTLSPSTCPSLPTSPSLPTPVSSSYSNYATLPSLSIPNPDWSPKSQPNITSLASIQKPVINLVSPSPNFKLPRSSICDTHARPSFLAQIQTAVWGHQDRAQYFSGEVRKTQIQRYKEKKANRHIAKRSIDAARSKVAKQRLRNSKGRFVVTNDQSINSDVTTLCGTRNEICI